MPKLTDVMGRPFSGLVPYAVPAIVTDNVDPDELGRIKVKFPTLHEEPLSFWIRQASPNAGKGRGIYALPEKEDEVLVLFLYGSQDVGVIIGQFWNGVDKPPKECKDAEGGNGKDGTDAFVGRPTPADTWDKGKWSTDVYKQGTTDLEKNDRRFWRSRSGHLFLFDDSAGEETVQIWDKSHTLALVFDSADSRILLTNSVGDIHIRTATDLYLESGNDTKIKVGNNLEVEVEADSNWLIKKNHTFEAKLKITHTSGQDYSITSKMNWKCEAKINLEAKAGVSSKVEAGATAEYKSGAPMTIKGAMVMIN